MADLPQLYTLKEVAAAMKCSPDTVRRALNRHPFIRTIGRGRGTRLTLEDYNALIEAMREPSPVSHPGDNAVRANKGRVTRALVKQVVERLRREKMD